MNKEDMQKAMLALGKANINIAGDFVMEKHVDYEIGNVESGGIGINIVNANGSEDVTDDINKEFLGKALQQVQTLFWGQSSYAVIYCVLRDYYKYGENLSLFEAEMNNLAISLKLDYLCPPNTVSSSFYNNSYLKMHVNKWENHQVKHRSVTLVKAFLEAIKQYQEK